MYDTDSFTITINCPSETSFLGNSLEVGTTELGNRRFCFVCVFRSVWTSRKLRIKERKREGKREEKEEKRLFESYLPAVSPFSFNFLVLQF